MNEEKEKKLYERVLYSKITLVFLIIIVFFMSKAVLGLYEKKQHTDESLEIAQRELVRTKERKDLLEGKLKSFATEKGIEMEIRDIFNVARDGEKVIVIVEDNTSSSTDSDKVGGGLWSWIKGIFTRD